MAITFVRGERKTCDSGRPADTVPDVVSLGHILHGGSDA